MAETNKTPRGTVETVPASLVDYALDAPTWEDCRRVLLDALHGCVGASNYRAVRATDAYKADAEKLGISELEAPCSP